MENEMRMNSMKWLLVPTVLVAAACGKDTQRLDDGLKNDLALAAQAYVPQQTVSPMEQAYNPYDPYVTPRPAAARVQTIQRAPAPVQRTTTVRRPASSSTASGGTIYSAPQPEPRIVKNTKRDAAIGAAAGAIIGATTSRDKVKGGLIGAAVGGIIGGVIGNNVDVQRKY
jgi:hypothetical protein